jgi:CheY-like chemotaxis protein
VLFPRARQKGLAFRCQIAPEVPDFLLGDPLRLQQVLMNLVGNAIKYTHTGSVELRVGCRAAVAPGVVELRLDVLDTGIGIPADKLDSIFEKFTQADGSTTREYGGTGLGLAISKSLVEMHGGRLWVESEVGLGSAFHVSLPLQLAPAPAPEAGGPTVKPPADAASNSPGHILIVEDNPTNQKVVVGLLGKRGYRTSVAGDGRQALEALERTAFDLILMDVQMPVLDGLEATRLIRRDARWKSLPVVGLTAHAMVGDRQRCLDAGMDDYLPKPIRPAALIETIQRCMPART